MVSEWPFGAQLAQLHVAFEHDLGLRGYFQIAGLALHHLHRTAAQEAGDHHFVKVRRQRQDGGKHGGGIGADGHGDIHALASRGGHAAIVLRALLVLSLIHI